MIEEEGRFILCINNGVSEDLEVRRVYGVLPDESAIEDDYLRVIDESGEDYLYPAEYFCPVEIAAKVRESFLRVA